MKNILVIGSTCVDVILRIDHLPRTEENIHPSSQRFTVGGCAYNVANILGRGGADMTFVTPVGRKGIFGGFVREALDRLGFCDYVDLPDGENGCCYCFVEKGGERTFASLHGVEYTFDPAWMERHAGKTFDYGYVCGLELGEPTGEALVSYLEHAPIKTLVYAPGPRGVHVDPALTERIYALHPILHLNAGEALAMSGADTIEVAMHALYRKTGSTVVATLGERGVCCLERSGAFTVASQPAAFVADTIGAGDAHAGAMLLGLCRGMAMRDALALANRVSAAVVMTEGATLSDEDFARIIPV